MKKIVITKVIAIAIIIIFGLFNYRLVSYDDGFKFVRFNDANVDSQTFFSGINHVYYYKNPFKSNYYVMVLDTSNQGIRLSTATQDDLYAFELASGMMANLMPQSVSVIPLWAYGIAIVVVIIFPLKRFQIFNE